MWIERYVNNHGYTDVNPVMYGYESVESGRLWDNLAKHFWCIHFVASGRGTFTINDHTYNIVPGDIFVIPPFIKVTYVADEVDPWSYMWIGFTTKATLPIEFSDVIHLPKARTVFEKAREVFNMTDGATEFLIAKIYELFSLINESKTSAVNPMQTAVDYIENNFAAINSVADIANYFHLDRCYFSVLFKKYTGLSPAQYLLNHRMQIATVMLGENLKIATVAHSVGYSDTFVFSKAFKRHFGVSPKQYVERMRLKQD